MNLQENIRRILREENTLPNLIRRRFSEEELYKLVSNVERTFETHRISQQHREDVIDAEVDDFIMNSVYYGEFEDFDDEIYQDIYNLYREPLVDYIKSKIDMNLQESIRRILKEETEMLLYIFDPKTNKVIGFNLVYGSEEYNNIRYDENGRGKGYGFGPQKDNFNNTIKFDSLEDAQKWYSDRTEKDLQKQTQNQEYSDLSYIAYNIRKIDDLDYQVINRGSCFKFAKEISKLGYDKFTFIFSEEDQEVIHVYVKLTNNLYFDANGFHTKKEIKNQYYVGEDTEMYDSGIDELGNFSDLDTYECLTTIPIPDNVWKKVIQVIKKSKMNLQESIRRILREDVSNRAQEKLNQVLKTQGVVSASKVVGGLDNLVKKLGLEMDDLKTQEMLAKSFIYHTDIEDVDILHLEINRDRPDKVRIKIHFNTNNPASNMQSWLVRTLCDEMNKFFPFKTAVFWEPAFAGRGVTVVLDSEQLVNGDDEDI